jgi:hypothetical protein
MIGVLSWSDSTDERGAGRTRLAPLPAPNDQMITRCEPAMSYIEPLQPLDEALMRWSRLNGCVVS